MDPEIILAVVALALFGVAVWLFAPVASWISRRSSSELAAWWRLVLPLFAGVLVLAFLFGWDLQEPTPADERVGAALDLAAFAVGAVVLRALVRAARSGRSQTSAGAIGTIGLLKPRVIVSAEFYRAATDDVLAAALAHEAAHLRGRDPCRIWLAQLAADLQWPIPGAARRFSEWLLALEAERDAEAVQSGVSEEDLAEAILVAAQIQCGRPGTVCAHAAGRGEGVAWRVRRLLARGASVQAERPRAPRWMIRASCVGMVSAAAWLGVCYGEAVLRALPGVGP